MALLFTFAIALSASAQASYATAMTITSATLTNAANDSAIVKATGSCGNAAFQLVVTKVSGTIGGVARLKGSLDGINYVSAVTDTVILTNVATNTYIWNIAPSKYLYYMIKTTGAGTMSATIKGWYLCKQ